jgi:hypothetical protein
MSDVKVNPEGQRLRFDAEAASVNTELPAFLAQPVGSPAYHGFPILEGSEIDGFVFGVITEPNGATAASWGDAYVIAPNGSRAGIVWSAGSGSSETVLPPEPGRWGVYQFYFDRPVLTERDLIANLQSVLPQLKVYFAEAERLCPESTQKRQQ